MRSTRRAGGRGEGRSRAGSGESGGNAVPVQSALIIVEKPAVADPEELGTPPAKSKTVWTWVLAGIGSIVTAVGNFMGGLDWRVQLFISAP